VSAYLLILRNRAKLGVSKDEATGSGLMLRDAAQLIIGLAFGRTRWPLLPARIEVTH